MGLFADALDQEVEELHTNGVRLRFIGDRQRLSVRLQSYLPLAEARTAANQKLSLNIAMSYGGRWESSPGRCASWPRNARPVPCVRRISPRSRWRSRSARRGAGSGSVRAHRG